MNNQLFLSYLAILCLVGFSSYQIGLNHADTEVTVDFQPEIQNKTEVEREIIDNSSTHKQVNKEIHRPWDSVHAIETETSRNHLTRCDLRLDYYGKSMRPALWQGAKLCLQELEPDEIESGMIVATEGDIIHMVSSYYPNRERVDLRGMNNWQEYPSVDYVKPENITHVLAAVQY